MTHILALLALFLGASFDAAPAHSQEPLTDTEAAGLSFPVAAVSQGIAGTYVLVGNDAAFLALVPIPFSDSYLVLASLNGAGLPNQHGIMSPAEGGGYDYVNQGGNMGHVTPTDTGLDVEMTSGDNKNKSSWIKV